MAIFGGVLALMGDDPGANKGQWPLISAAVGYFAINPIDKNGGLISSGAGRVFRENTNGGIVTGDASGVQCRQ